MFGIYINLNKLITQLNNSRATTTQRSFNWNPMIIINIISAILYVYCRFLVVTLHLIQTIFSWIALTFDLNTFLLNIVSKSVFNSSQWQRHNIILILIVLPPHGSHVILIIIIISKQMKHIMILNFSFLLSSDNCSDNVLTY